MSLFLTIYKSKNKKNCLIIIFNSFSMLIMNILFNSNPRIDLRYNTYPATFAPTTYPNYRHQYQIYGDADINSTPVFAPIRSVSELSSISSLSNERQPHKHRPHAHRRHHRNSSGGGGGGFIHRSFNKENH